MQGSAHRERTRASRTQEPFPSLGSSLLSSLPSGQLPLLLFPHYVCMPRNFVWVPSEVDFERKIQIQVVYLGVYPGGNTSQGVRQAKERK